MGRQRCIKCTRSLVVVWYCLGRGIASQETRHARRPLGNFIFLEGCVDSLPWDRMIREVILHMSLSVKCVAAIPLSYIPQGNHENHAEPCTQPLTEHEYDRSLQLRCRAPFLWVSIGAGSMSMPRELASSTRFTHPEGQPFKSTPAFTQSPLSRSQT